MSRQKRRHITMRFAPTRASRAPEYTALRTRRHENELDEVWRGMPMGVRASAASRTSERYAKLGST